MAACCHFVVDLETNSITIFIPTQRTGLLTLLLTCSPLLFSSLLLGNFILTPTPFLPFTLRCKIILSPTPFLPFTLWTHYSMSNFTFSLFLFGQNNSKSVFPLLFVLPGIKVLNQTPKLRNYSQSSFFLT